MNDPTRRRLRTGDAVLFQRCLHESFVTQAMVEGASESQALDFRARNAAGVINQPNPTTDSFGRHLVGSLPVEAARWLTCPQCGDQGATKLESGLSFRDPAPSSATENEGSEQVSASEGPPAKYAHYCRKCRGFNGLEEYCHHCGGTGFEPETQQARPGNSEA